VSLTLGDGAGTVSLGDRLNELGSEGWELVCLDKVRGASSWTAFMKRPLVVDEPKQLLEESGDGAG
jgi:hypothetical protein